MGELKLEILTQIPILNSLRYKTSLRIQNAVCFAFRQGCLAKGEMIDE